MIPKKSLGQNFLTNEAIAKKIADSANLSSSDNVLEIGPGTGMLTKYLAEKTKKILAVEIDKRLIESVRCSSKDIKIIEGDILKINLPKILEENDLKKYKVIANLPYYITSKIIRLFLETKYPPHKMILMVQKEVGERIVALDGKESKLSISVKFYAEPKILFEVSRENFDPVPDVDSTVIMITGKSKIPEIDQKKFFALVRAGFSAKRKMLANNLAASCHVPKTEITEMIKKAGLNPTTRAEKLSLQDWLMLYSTTETQL